MDVELPTASSSLHQKLPPVDMQQLGVLALNMWIVALAILGCGATLIALICLLTPHKSVVTAALPWWLCAFFLDDSPPPVETASDTAVDTTVARGPRPPRHIAAVMDGNRRFGVEKHGNALQGHWAGGDTLSNFIDWSIKHGVEILTVYAFSTENWNRPKEEVDTLMHIFEVYTSKIRADSLAKGVRVRLISSDAERLPKQVRQDLLDLEELTKHCTTFQLNICVSYGARGEIVNAAKTLAAAAARGEISVESIDEAAMEKVLATHGIPDPDVLLRTSEMRLSNFLLWQLAYTELMFVDKLWPEVTEDDLIKLIDTYKQRQRRFGK